MKVMLSERIEVPASAMLSFYHAHRGVLDSADARENNS